MDECRLASLSASDDFRCCSDFHALMALDVILITLDVKTMSSRGGTGGSMEIGSGDDGGSDMDEQNKLI